MRKRKEEGGVSDKHLGRCVSSTRKDGHTLAELQ